MIFSVAELINYKLIGPDRTQDKWLQFIGGANWFSIMPNHGEMIIYGLKAKSQSLNLTKKLPFFDTVLTLELIAP